MSIPSIEIMQKINPLWAHEQIINLMPGVISYNYLKTKTLIETPNIRRKSGITFDKVDLLVHSSEIYKWIFNNIDKQLKNAVIEPIHYNIFSEKIIENYDERLIKPFSIKFNYKRFMHLFIPEYWDEYTIKLSFPKSIIFYIKDKIRLLISDVSELIRIFCDKPTWQNNIDIQFIIDDLLDHPNINEVKNEVFYFLNKTEHMISGSKEKLDKFLFLFMLDKPDIVKSICYKFNKEKEEDNIFSFAPLTRSDFTDTYNVISKHNETVLRSMIIPKNLMMGDISSSQAISGRVALQTMGYTNDV
jgi:hypothetical protein